MQANARRGRTIPQSRRQALLTWGGKWLASSVASLVWECNSA